VVLGSRMLEAGRRARAECRSTSGWATASFIKVSKTLFAYQIYVEAETTSDADFVLETSQAASLKSQS